MKHSNMAPKLVNLIRISTAAVLLTGMLAVTQPARADTVIVVENTDNTGPGSLRYAILGAYLDPTPNIITFDDSLNGIPIVLSGPAGEDGNVSGDLDIKDGGNLTIQGNGTANTIIDGGGVDRVFHICPGGGCISTVTITGLTIRNGAVSSGGGGIFSEGGTTWVVSSNVVGNTADYGGGIYNNGTLTITDSKIGEVGAGNTATVNGGGIFNASGTATLIGSTVSDNDAVDGGGIFNYEESILTIRNGSTIGGIGAGNTATAIGGGIYNQSSNTTTVNASTISANTATSGGGIYNKGTTLNILNGSTIGGAGTGNEAAELGGGIYNYAGATAVDSSTVSANRAHNGGGIYNMATLNIRNSSTIGGAGAGNQGIDNHPNGGGIYNDTGGTTTVDSSTISANTSYNGGGVDNRGTLTVTNSTIGEAGAGNQSAEYGGGIYNGAGGIATVDGSTVSANTARIGGGVDNRGTLTVTDSIIGGAGEGNEAKDGGGGIYNGVGGMATVDGSTVSVNTAKNGGGIFNQGMLDVTNSTIGGAGMDNQATIWGGGIYNNAGTTTVMGSCILNNWATINGGGLFNDENSFGATIVTGSSIVSNSATSFFNNQAAQQIATGNWWGAATGPNKPGADTVDGNVDTGGYLTEPISACLTNIYLPLVRK